MSSMALERGTMKKGITGHEEEGIETDESQMNVGTEDLK
jgi:hypothetical protein